MARYIEGWNRSQSFLLPECVDDYVDENNPVRVVDAFVDELDLAQLGFGRAVPAETGRPAYHPAVMLKLYVYGYLNRIPSSRRLEREAQRNIELVWLTGRLAPDFKTIADFRRDNGPAIRAACRHFVMLCRKLDLFATAEARPSASDLLLDRSSHQLQADMEMSGVNTSAGRLLVRVLRPRCSNCIIKRRNDRRLERDSAKPSFESRARPILKTRPPQSHPRLAHEEPIFAPR